MAPNLRPVHSGQDLKDFRELLGCARELPGVFRDLDLSFVGLDGAKAVGNNTKTTKKGQHGRITVVIWRETS